jgi:hypothetical protein
MAEGEFKKLYLPMARKHCMKGAEWGHTMATDYWLTLNPGLDIAGAASTATGDELAENGWVATSLVNTVGSGADFGSVADTGIPNHLLTNASADLLSSPAIFGDYAHMVAAAHIVGKRHTDLPRYLVADFWGSMSVMSATPVEPRSNWGFIVAGGSPATEANQLASISVSDAGGFFQIGVNTVYTLGTIAGDTTWRFFRIKLDRINNVAQWFILNATTGIMDKQPNSSALTTDVYPLKFGFHALTTNRPLLGLTHVYYDW